MDFRLPLTICVLGGGAVFWGAREWSIASESRDDADRITCKALATIGPGANTHVRLADFVLAPDYLYESVDGRWKRVWAAALPIDGPYAQAVRAAYEKGDRLEMASARFPRPVNVIVESSDVHDPDEFEKFAESAELEGIALPASSTLSAEEERRLRGTFGDLTNTKIVHLGRTRTNRLLSLLAMLGGAGAIVGVGVSAFLGRPSRRRGPPRTTRAPRTPLASRPARSRW